MQYTLTPMISLYCIKLVTSNPHYFSARQSDTKEYIMKIAIVVLVALIFVLITIGNVCGTYKDSSTTKSTDIQSTTPRSTFYPFQCQPSKKM